MRLFQSISTVLLLCLFLVSCRDSPITDDITLKQNQAYYYFKVSKILDGTDEFNFTPYRWGLTGEATRTLTRRGLIGDEINLVYVVDLADPKTAKELRIESQEAIKHLRKIADFTLEIKTWDGR